ncbi:MAG: TIGR00159 family protein [Elusimicrobia bacterium]|nr:TIGR00159 family protein [Elusimicrobiota bacterium]
MSPQLADTLRVIIDLALASFLLYKVIILIRGTKSAQVAIGLLVLLVMTYLVRLWDLTVTSWLLEQFWLAGILLLVVVFQPEIREALAQLGKSPLVAKLLFSEKLGFLEEIFETLDDLSRRKVGALIVLEQETGLKEYVLSGVFLGAETSKELLLSIFQPGSPLHDGAVLIGPDGKAMAAKCILPVTQGAQIAKAYGVRHRAAVGLSEVSDAVVLVVSEETGRISVARNGRLDPDATLESLAAELRALYQAKAKKSLLRSMETSATGGRRASGQ